MSVSQKMVAAWWGFLGLVITAIAVPIVIAAPNVAAWGGLAVGLVLTGLAGFSVTTGRAVFGDGTPCGGGGGAGGGGAGGGGGCGGSGC